MVDADLTTNVLCRESPGVEIFAVLRQLGTVRRYVYPFRLFRPRTSAYFGWTIATVYIKLYLTNPDHEVNSV